MAKMFFTSGGDSAESIKGEIIDVYSRRNTDQTPGIRKCSHKSRK